MSRQKHPSAKRRSCASPTAEAPRGLVRGARELASFLLAGAAAFIQFWRPEHPAAEDPDGGENPEGAPASSGSINQGPAP